MQSVRFPHQPPRAIPDGRFANSAAGDETDFGLLDRVPTQPTQRKQLPAESFSLRANPGEVRAPREMFAFAKPLISWGAHIGSPIRLPDNQTGVNRFRPSRRRRAITQRPDLDLDRARNPYCRFRRRFDG